MTVTPLIAYAEGDGLQIIDLNEVDKKIGKLSIDKLSVECPSVDVTGPSPPPGGGGAGLGIALLGLAFLGIVMTTGKKKS